MELRPELPAPVLVEVARDVAVRVVVEDDRDHVDLLLDGRRHLLGVVEEAAVARDHDHRAVGAGDLGADRGRVLEAEIAGVGRRDVGPRAVDGKEGPGEIADLRHAGHDDRLLGNALAERAEDRGVRLLRHEPGDLGADLLALGLARLARLGAGA